MSRTIITLLIGLLVILAGCTSSSSEANSFEKKQGKILLKVATHTNLEHYSYTEGIKRWMDKVTDLTEGQVEFEFYPSEQIGKAKDNYSLVKNKTIDIAYIVYEQDKIPLTNIPMLPALYETAYEGTKAYWNLASEGGLMFEKVFKPNGIRPIFTFAVSPYTFGTVDKKVERAEDLQGLNLRSSGGLHDLSLVKLKGTPISMEMTNTRQALETGTVEGIMTSWLSITPYQLEKPINYIITNAPLNGWAAYFAINEEVYQELPQNVKEAMAEASEETVDNLANIIQIEEEKEMVLLESAGIDFYPLSDTELEKWKKDLTPLISKWIENMENKGEPAQEIYDAFLKEIEENK